MKKLRQNLSFLVLINFKTTSIESVISTTLLHKAVVVTTFNDSSVVHNHDNVRVNNGWKDGGQ